MALYPFMVRNDGTDISYSKIQLVNNVEVIRVDFERVSADGDFDSMECYLPEGKMKKINGYTEEEVKIYTDLALLYQPLFFKFARQGGIGNRA